MGASATEANRPAADAAATPPEAPDDVIAPTGRSTPWWHVSFAAAVGAVAFGALALTPSLLPRSGLVQGLILGVGAAVGYGLASFLAWLIRQFTSRTQPWAGTPRAWWALAAASSVVLIAALWSGKQTQDDLFALMDLDQPTGSWYAVVLLVGVLVGVLLIGISRLVRRLARAVTRQTSRVVPPRTARAIGILVAGLITVLIINGVLLDGMLAAADAAFASKNDTTTEGTTQPTSTAVSGGSSSLVAWDDLGRKGRDFVAGASDPTDLSTFNDSPAKSPVRAYVGLESSASAEERAQLAVKELKALGGFDRKVLAIGTTTGTGWVDEGAVDPLEYMFNGDTATVATQYSYLPSWLSFLVDKKRAKEAGVTLFDAVYGEWIKRPANDRPRLVVFGESLGSFGGEAAFSGLPDILNRTSGALFAGPPNSNALWTRYTDNRDAGSPEVLPTYRNGENLRWAQVPDDLEAPTATWDKTRVMYLQNASDPIVWWSPSLLTAKPDWLDEPRGRDVLPEISWWPILTFFQVSADMINSTGVPNGHGHSYGTNQVWAWASVLQPPGWTEAKSEKLIRTLS